MTSSNDSDAHQDVQNAGNCRAMSIPIRAWLIHKKCRNRIETACKSNLVYRDRVERAEQRNMDFHANEMERNDHSRRASLEPSVVPGLPIEETETEDQSIAREAKRARGEQVQDLSGEIHIPSAEETLTTPESPETPDVPSSSNQSSSTSIPTFPGVSILQWQQSVHTVRVQRCQILLVSRQEWCEASTR